MKGDAKAARKLCLHIDQLEGVKALLTEVGDEARKKDSAYPLIEIDASVAYGSVDRLISRMKGGIREEDGKVEEVKASKFS